jgi:hypothetical protein
VRHYPLMTQSKRVYEDNTSGLSSSSAP